MSAVRSMWLAVLLVLAATSLAISQENATITGTVTDSTGAAVPNALVTVTHISTGIARTTRSDGAGLYSFSALQIGTYNLTVTASGFKSYTKTGLVLNETQ